MRQNYKNRRHKMREDKIRKDEIKRRTRMEQGEKPK